VSGATLLNPYLGASSPETAFRDISLAAEGRLTRGVAPPCYMRAPIPTLAIWAASQQHGRMEGKDRRTLTTRCGAGIGHPPSPAFFKHTRTTAGSNPSDNGSCQRCCVCLDSRMPSRSATNRLCCMARCHISAKHAGRFEKSKKKKKSSSSQIN
jgi:hypothetical protein